jgi:hypothetical protein
MALKLKKMQTHSRARNAILTIILILSAGVAAEAQWKAAASRVRITPERPVWLAGYDARVKPFEAVETDIWAKALAFEDEGGRRAVLVTADLIGFSAPVAELIVTKIREKTSLERNQILLNASHNHSGPALSLDPKPRGKMSAEDVGATAAYTRALAEKIAGAVAESFSRLEPVRLSWGTGIAFFAMNRREHTPNGIILGVNPRGPADRSVPVLRVETPDGKLRAAVFGAACHNTTLTANNFRINADYAGFAQSYIEEKYPGAQALFVTGCGADANPYPRGTFELAREHGANLGKEVCRVLEGKLEPVRGALTVTFDTVDLPMQPMPPREELERRTRGPSWLAGTATTLLEMLARNETPPRHYTAPVAVWQFGEDLTLVALSGEVVVDYVALLTRTLGPLRLWIAGYSNEVFGYFPSARVLEEGGYETRGVSGGKGWFAPEAQGVLVQKVRELTARAGRKNQ